MGPCAQRGPRLKREGRSPGAGGPDGGDPSANQRACHMWKVHDVRDKRAREYARPWRCVDVVPRCARLGCLHGPHAAPCSVASQARPIKYLPCRRSFGALRTAVGSVSATNSTVLARPLIYIPALRPSTCLHSTRSLYDNHPRPHFIFDFNIPSLASPCSLVSAATPLLPCSPPQPWARRRSARTAVSPAALDACRSPLTWHTTSIRLDHLRGRLRLQPNNLGSRFGLHGCHLTR